MNTTSKASNAFEAFFGIHETLPRGANAIELKRLHEEPSLYNIRIYLQKPLSNQHYDGIFTNDIHVNELNASADGGLNFFLFGFFSSSPVPEIGSGCGGRIDGVLFIFKLKRNDDDAAAMVHAIDVVYFSACYSQSLFCWAS